MVYDSLYHIIEDIYEHDKRYKPDSYGFVLEALRFSQIKFKKTGHLTGKELLEGIRELIIIKFGPMARHVLNYWGITKTEDFGNIVFILIDKNLLQKTENDSLDDFKDVYDFDEVFKNAPPDISISD